MTDFNFDDLEKTDDASWVRIDAELDPIMKNVWGEKTTIACARIALAVAALVRKGGAMPPALRLVLMNLMLTDVLEPVVRLPKRMTLPDPPPVIKSEAEIEEEGWTGIDESLMVLEFYSEFLAVWLQAVAQILGALADEASDGTPSGRAMTP